MHYFLANYVHKIPNKYYYAQIMRIVQYFLVKNFNCFNLLTLSAMGF